jgi:Flp pilus assembly protein TadG
MRMALNCESVLSDPRASRNREAGATLVEFAFVLVILLMSLFGIIDFGRALYTFHFVTNAAREGTRYAMVRGSTCNPSLTDCPAGTLTYQTYLRNQMNGVGLDPSSVTAPITWPSISGQPPACTSIAQNYPGCTVQVHVTYAFKFIFPFMPSNFTIQSTSEMVISQ